MTKNKFTQTNTAAIILALIVSISFVSCKKSKTGEDKSLPEIYAVTDLTNRSIHQTAVNYGDWIIIKGKNLSTTYKVDFNSVLASDSLIYADDTSVTVKIPATLPAPADNPITVTTKYGSATYNFKILQPAPVITSFDPGAGPSGQEVTIKGSYFGGVSSVKFDDLEATIISNTKEEIKVTVPAGVTVAYIFVTTGSGTVRSAFRYGLKYEIFTNALTTGWTYSPSSANVTYNATITDTVKRGTNSLRIDFKGSFSYLRLVKTGGMSSSGYQGIKFSMYAPESFLNKKVRIYMNGSTASTYTITVTKINEWIDYELPFINFGNPATITQIIFNEFSGSAGLPRQIYVDDLGLY